ncbi:hypothetical protein NDU88_007497 [Pleurodeles waltl]|uniref:Uncharacterized protein n=1 Tax=Pleurodeles waltl TaxID=8319 RepID=A0AAV7N2D8_PLEWA|nr:hypothetical protein NDU88_007497 [Pleurodeles waltl]
MCRDPGAVLVIVAAVVEKRPPLYAAKTATAADSSSPRILSCQRFPCLAQPQSLKGRPASRWLLDLRSFPHTSFRKLPPLLPLSPLLRGKIHRRAGICRRFLFPVSVPDASATLTVASGSRVGGADKPRDYTATMLLQPQKEALI